MFINLVGLFQPSNICPVSRRCILKIPTQMSVIWEVQAVFRGEGGRGGSGSLRSVQIQTRYFLQMWTLERPKPPPTPLLSSLPGYGSENLFCLLVPGLYLWPCLLIGGGGWGRGHSPVSMTTLMTPSQMHFLFVNGSPMASTEQDYLFLTFVKKKIQNSFSAPVEREHELFFKFLYL